MGKPSIDELKAVEREQLLKLARSLSFETKFPVMSPITPCERGGRLLLSFAQQRLWFLAQMEGASEAYHIPLGLRLKGDLDYTALRRALDRILARHEALRTTFVSIDGEPVQRIATVEGSSFLLIEHDLRSHNDAKAELDRVTELEASASFDLEAGPLIRGRLIRLSEDEHVLLITMHHIASDGWSMGVLVNELSTLYGAFLRGEDDPLPKLDIQYADYAMWQRQWIEGDILKQQAAYWKTALAGAPALLELPADHPRPDRQDYAGGFVELALDEHLTAGLRELSRRHGATMFMTLLAAWAVLLARLSGQQDVVIGTPAANRGRTEIENLIGFFVNTLVMRLDLSGSLTVSELLEQAKAQALAAQEHQDIPFEQVVELAQPVRSLAHHPLFQVMFAWQNNAQGIFELPGLDVQSLRSPHKVAKFDLLLELRESGNSITGGIEYATSLFERATIDRYIGYFRNLLRAMVADDTQAVDRLAMLPENERRHLLYELNDTKADFPRDKCVHALFEEQVAKTPDASAVVFEGQEISYAELNQRANQLAHYLRQLGVKPDARVAICMERSFEVVVAFLAVLKAGGAYLPLDPDYPVERLRFMLQDSEAVALLTQSHFVGLFAEIDHGLPVLQLDDAVSQWKGQPESNPSSAEVGLSSLNLAYIIYTSGSTGQPKGVMVPHRAINRLVLNNGYAKIGPGDRVAFAANPAFDASTLEVWAPLLNGGCIVVIGQAVLLEPVRFGEVLRSQKIDLLWLTVGLFNQYAETLAKDFAGLRYLMVGGDALNVGVIARVLQNGPPQHLLNGYGPTETTTFATTYEITAVREDARSIPIGRPIANTQTYILNALREPVPVGVPGELYIGGAGVARGYLNRPELTAERFLPDPFSSEPGARMYRTGDMARWLADGTIEFLGRNDFQVKIRGFRIELGEIEARLAEHPAVREAVVVAREDTPGDKRLVAYYIASPLVDESEEGTVGAEQFRSHLSASLPDYMIPAAFVRLESLPLTFNGKLDRKALPAPEADAYSTRGYEPPQGEMEMKLAAIWAEALKLDRVGRHDNFFAIGGHSLLAVQVVTRLRQEMDVEVAIRDLFAQPELADLARALESAAPSKLPSITPCERGGRLLLSFAQQRLWFLAQMEGASEAYHIPFGLRLKGDLDYTALRRALDRILARHEALRTTFVSIDGEPVQRIAAVEGSSFLLIEHDLRSHNDAKAELDRVTELEASASFDLEAGPLIRGRLIRLSEDEHVLLITMHHIASDGWSVALLIKELSVLYAAFLRGQDNPLPKLDIQYADYSVWQRRWNEGDLLKQQAGYWKTALAGAPTVLDVPADHPRPALQDYTGDFEKLELDEQLTTGLKEFSRRHRVTLFMTLMAAWAALLARLSGQQDVLIGTPVANRGQKEIGDLIGFFVNTLVVRLNLSDSPSVNDLLEQTKAQTLAALQHQDIPFEQVVELTHPVRSMAHSPLLQVIFAWQNTDQETLKLPEIEALFLPTQRRMAKFDLLLDLQEAGNTISGGIEYATSLFEQSTIKRYIGYFRMLLQGMVADDTQAVDRLPILPESERHQILVDWNNTAADFPSDKCVHQLFEEQAARTPDAVAVVFEDETLSYAELNRRANLLAHYLRKLGVKPDARVAICAQRSLEMVVALLAVLKAGGAYVPLDPAYPVDRLHFMLEDSEPVALLIQDDLRGLFSGTATQIPVVSLTDPASWSRFPNTNPDLQSIGVAPQHLAYVIYTSGSTGKPKGVLVEHANVARLFSATDTWFHFDESDVWTLFHSYAFDFSVWEIWGALLYGGRLVVVPKDTARSASDFYKLICREKVTVLNQTPSAFRQLIAAQGTSTDSHRLRYVIFGGEALEVATLKPWYEQNRGMQTQLINMYGITETTVHVTYRPLSYVDTQRHGSSPIGGAIPDLTIYILDAYGQPVPIGVTGELYVGGAGVARGYLNRPELTAGRFLADPFNSKPGARMYRTGDLGRWLSDGSIEYLGRNDFQVKIRGFRIELGEIETRLAGYPGVGEAVVIAREDTPGDKRLVAYYTTPSIAESKQGTISAEQFRAHLLENLPEYMVPAAYVHMQSLPLTNNGKLDRKALPVPEIDSYSTRGYEPPQGETEIKLAAIWADLLKLDRVGRHDNFFDLGGHSLMLVQVVTRLRQVLSRAVEMRELFAHPQLAEMASALESAAHVVLLPITRAARKRQSLPLSLRVSAAPKSDGHGIGSGGDGVTRNEL